MMSTAEALSGALARPDFRANEAAFRQMLDLLPAAIYTTDADGTVTFANRAAAALAGREPQPGVDKWCIGFRLYRVDGTPLPLEDCPMALALQQRRPVRDIEIVAERPDGQRVPVMPFPTPLHDAAGNFVGAVNVLMDISKLKRAEREEARRADVQAALYRFTDRLYRASGMEETVEAALDAIVEALGCPRASILLMDSAGVARFAGWRGLSDGYRAAVEGHCPWRMGERDPQPIFVPDIELAEESEQIKETVRREGIRGLAFIPLVVHGGVIGKFMTYDATARIFSDDERALAVTIARQLGFAIERRRAEQQRDLMVAELSHRVKNTLATVITIARQSFGKDMPVEDARRSFDGRIRALAQTHGRLAEASWSGVSVGELLSDELAPYRRDDGHNVTLFGPAVSLTARQGIVLGMAFHELATNAAKYGSLSAKCGAVAVVWNVEEGRLRIVWSERGGPVVAPPQRRGFGCLLLERAIASDIHGEVQLDFAADGVRCTLSLPLDQPAELEDRTAAA